MLCRGSSSGTTMREMRRVIGLYILNADVKGNYTGVVNGEFYNSVTINSEIAKPEGYKHLRTTDYTALAGGALNELTHDMRNVQKWGEKALGRLRKRDSSRYRRI
jgi:hypothetical protein